MAANLAKFKITGSLGGASASSAKVYRAVPGEVLTLEIETPTPVLSTLYELYGAGGADQPLASYNAYSLQFAGSVYSKLVTTSPFNTTITMPTQELDTHSWILRATASVDGGSHRFERKIVYSMGKPDKNIPGETTQGYDRGWYDEIAKIIGSSLPFYDARGQTTNATPTNLGSGFVPPRKANFEIRGRLTAQVVNTASSYKVWDLLGAVRTDAGGVISFVGGLPTFTLVRDESGGGFLPGAPAMVTSGSFLYPQVTGIAATNINWHCFYDMAIEAY